MKQDHSADSKNHSESLDKQDIPSQSSQLLSEDRDLSNKCRKSDDAMILKDHENKQFNRGMTKNEGHIPSYFENFQPIENFKENFKFLKSEVKDAYSKRHEVITKKQFKDHFEYIKLSTRSTLIYAKDHLFNFSNYEDSQSRKSMNELYNQYRWQIIIMSSSMISMFLMRKQLKQLLLDSRKSKQGDQDFLQRLQSKFYGPAPSFQNVQYQKISLDNLIYRYNMSISIGVFLFGYGISLSGHTLYQLFCKNHQNNVEQSGKDDEE
ncbi:UNKNOWN [Stylonychia lemnae]|uniref:Transmembrane protein n=1 Tax=Stylonychia lemnae TaxID=5949 RepID=A0A078AQ16_STYLE|nr:UNKNOWN [Stylonychia lemnae]|eukprot:CDW84061.1 UNKNOWN [Stylonychia lemnae]